MKKLSNLQEDSEKQFNELRNKINELKECLAKKIEIPEVKKSAHKMKNALKSIGDRADQTEKRIGELENRNLEMIQVEERELRFLRSKETLQELSDSTRRTNIKIMGTPGEKERGAEDYLKKQ